MAEKPWKVLKSDGSLNVARRGYKARSASDFYHLLLSVSWPRFFTVITLGYIVANFLFAIAYYLCGDQAIEGLNNSGLSRFTECFFFSVQTFATIGYGKLNPASISANLIVIFEAFFGLLSVAIVTGLLFSRFSRPTARVLFSKFALITKDGGSNALLIRMANERFNQIAEARVDVALVKNEKTPEGDWYRRIYNLELERKESALFALSWTIVHRIDEKNPLDLMNEKKWREDQYEVVVSVSGIDETFGQAIHARHSYTVDDIKRNARFHDIISQDGQGRIQVDLRYMHEVIS